MDWPRHASTLHPRSRTTHKGQCGHVLIIGGTLGMGGALRLAGEGALRSGAGLVTLATDPQHSALLNLNRPELMCHGVAHVEDLEPLLQRANVVVIGPGLGRSAWANTLFNRVLNIHQPLIVDADALNLLAATPTQRANWILTPHPGEAARLWGGEQITAKAVQQDRFAAAAAIQARYGGVLVLKGSGTIISSNSHRPPAVCSAGNPGMASGGMGDLLTGIIAGILAQGWELEDAANMGVCLHAAAADCAAADGGERGLIASDVAPYVRTLFNPTKR
jgi:NAD(P)H-hydrate epimerase